MALSIVLGSSGSGKSTYVYDKIIDEAMASRDKNFLIIVPEQYTMSTQRLIVERHPKNCIMNIDVLSFNRLAYRVFEELGVKVLDILDDVGKSLVLRKLVDDKLDDLGILKKNMTRISYITQVKSLISEMTQYNISPDKLKEMIGTNGMSETFRRKASDLLVMYEAFLDFTNNKYITTEAILSELNLCLEDSKIVNGSTVVLDGFTGFTPLQYELVGHMLEICDEVVVTITGDADENYVEKKDENDLFEMSAKFVSSLTGLAKNHKTDINDIHIVDGENGRLSNNSVLSHLEKNIFRSTYTKFKNPTEAAAAIGLVSLKNPRAELSYAAVEISKLIRTGNYRYKDFAIVCPNLEQYRYLVEDIFKAYDISFFIDAKTEILFHPLVEAISALFELYESNYSKDAVLRFLRAGFTPLSSDDIDFLENYIISTGIRGKKKYFHPFAIKSNTYHEDEAMLRVNAIREQFIGPLQMFDKKIGKDSTVRDIAIAIYELLTAFECEKKLAYRQFEHEQAGHLIKAKEYKQIYPAVMDLLDKMVAILGDEKMDMEEFSDVFNAGLSAVSIGVIPPDSDSVIIGDMERTRLDKIKVLFLVGASDAAIPKKVENGGILSQLEREKLLEAGYEMAPSDRQKAFRQRFYLYMMLTKPSERLLVTSPRVDNSGSACNLSYIFELISNMFDVDKTFIEDFSIDDQLMSKDTSVSLLINLLQKAAITGFEAFSQEEFDSLKKLISWFKLSDEEKLRELITAVFYKYSKETFSEAVMLAVNECFNDDETVSGSVSKFETYSQCSYKYFLSYVLRLSEREEASLSSLDMGNFYHDALDKYGKLLKNDNKQWTKLTKDERGVYIDAAIRTTFESMKKISTLEDPTQAYIVESMKRTLEVTVDIVTEQIRRGYFEPEFYEEPIKTDIESINTNEPVASLHGKVDRIDLTPGEDRGVRIIDYKSSAHRISLDEVYYGLSLQLPIYMDVVLEKLSKTYSDSTLRPSAMLYYRMENPFVETSDKEKSYQEALLAKSMMDGLICDDPIDIEANDATISPDGEQASSVVPLKYTKNNGLDKRSSHAIPRLAMDVMLEYAKAKAGLIAEDILEGKFEPKPNAIEGKEHCMYCGYNSICHFNENIDGFEANVCQKNEDIISLMSEVINLKVEGGEDNGLN